LGRQFGGDGGDVEGAESFFYVGGTVKGLDWMTAQGEVPDHCLVGEPTNRDPLDEAATLAGLEQLTAIDRRLPELYFADPPCPA
jgi:hypothetical protein